MGLSTGGLICGETTDIIRKNKNLYFKKLRKCIVLFVYLPIKGKFVPEIVALWLKNWNQRVHRGGLMRGDGGLI